MTIRRDWLHFDKGMYRTDMVQPTMRSILLLNGITQKWCIVQMWYNRAWVPYCYSTVLLRSDVSYRCGTTEHEYHTVTQRYYSEVMYRTDMVQPTMRSILLLNGITQKWCIVQIWYNQPWVPYCYSTVLLRSDVSYRYGTTNHDFHTGTQRYYSEVIYRTDMVQPTMRSILLLNGITQKWCIVQIWYNQPGVPYCYSTVLLRSDVSYRYGTTNHDFHTGTQRYYSEVIYRTDMVQPTMRSILLLNGITQKWCIVQIWYNQPGVPYCYSTVLLRRDVSYIYGTTDHAFHTVTQRYYSEVMYRTYMVQPTMRSILLLNGITQKWCIVHIWYNRPCVPYCYSTVLLRSDISYRYGTTDHAFHTVTQRYYSEVMYRTYMVQPTMRSILLLNGITQKWYIVQMWYNRAWVPYCYSTVLLRSDISYRCGTTEHEFHTVTQRYYSEVMYRTDMVQPTMSTILLLNGITQKWCIVQIWYNQPWLPYWYSTVLLRSDISYRYGTTDHAFHTVTQRYYSEVMYRTDMVQPTRSTILLLNGITQKWCIVQIWYNQPWLPYWYSTVLLRSDISYIYGTTDHAFHTVTQRYYSEVMYRTDMVQPTRSTILLLNGITQKWCIVHIWYNRPCVPYCYSTVLLRSDVSYIYGTTDHAFHTVTQRYYSEVMYRTYMVQPTMRSILLLNGITQKWYIVQIWYNRPCVPYCYSTVLLRSDVSYI